MVEAGVARTIRIAGLPPGTAEREVLAVAVAFGVVRGVKMEAQREHDAEETEALVTFEDPDDAAEAKDNLAESELNGYVLHVSFAEDPEKGQSTRRAVWDDADKYFGVEQTPSQDLGA